MRLAGKWNGVERYIEAQIEDDGSATIDGEQRRDILEAWGRLDEDFLPDSWRDEQGNTWQVSDEYPGTGARFDMIERHDAENR